MTNEIKEILFLLHNDRLTESGKRKLEDYITNLQEEIDSLHIINDENRYLIFDNKQRIDKAVEYILQNICVDKNIKYSSEEVYKVLDILRGDE